MLKPYQSLSRNERRAAKKLAKELLRTVPPAPPTTTEELDRLGIRGALATAFLKPANVVAALVYTDGAGNWWGDVVFKKGDGGTVQVGVQEKRPVSSYAEAYEAVKEIIAGIKAAPAEHPIVQKMRAAGFDPESITLFRIDHTAFDRRFVLLTDEQVEMGADMFAFFYDKLTTEQRDVPEARELARELILEAAPRFATEDAEPFLQRPEEGTTSPAELLYCAAAFLVKCGIMNIDCDTKFDGTGTVVSNSEPASPALH